MSLTLLFDLDDTLLDTNIETFVSAYFQALSEHMSPYVAADKMLPALLSATKLMMDSDDPLQTLQTVFETKFYSAIGIAKHELLEMLEGFYDNIFPKLGKYTNQRPEAVSVIEWAFSRGYRVAIATDPLFPRKATRHRLRWAGFDPDQFELVSSFEDFHFSKTHPAYYAEVLGRLGWPDGPVLMVGNDVKRDLIPANRLGLKTYFIDGDSASSPGFEAGRGKLADLRPWLESVDLSTLEPLFKSPEAVLAILKSTPAVFHSITSLLTNQQWSYEPAKDNWAMSEVICHLRDTESEIHRVQLDLMLTRADVFIPRPDTSVWSSERDYLHVNGAVALQEFISARIDNLERLKTVNELVWAQKARHAIFGPTNFLEVISFTADHDRMHIQQAWKLLQSVQNCVSI